MGTFNIDFNQFKPSKKPVVSPTPNSTPMPSPAPMASTPPVMQSSPAPVVQSTQMQSVPQQSKSGLQKVFDALMIPSKALGGFLQGTRQSAENRVQELRATGGKPQAIDYVKAFGAGVKNIPSGIKNNITPSKAMAEYSRTDPVSTAISKFNTNKYGAFVTDVTADPLNIIPFGAGGKLLTKGGKYVSKVTGAAKVIDKVSDFAKSTPAIYKVIEKVNPYFRIPEFGNVVKAAEQATGTRISKLYRELQSMVKGLTPNDQIHVGQIVEGIVKPTSTKAAKIASRVTEISRQIGQEAVDTGLMTKKVFNKMTAKGYLSHIFTNEVKNIPSTVKGVNRVVGSMFKKRKGAEGYVKQFAPAVYKGLGSEIKDIEVAKMFKNIASEFGTKLGRGGKALPGYVKASEVGIKGRAFAKSFQRIQIPQAIADYLNNVRKVNTPNAYDKLLNAWKAGKTIWNPAYHVRNTISNQILSSMGTGKNLISTISDYISAVKEYKAGTSSLFKVAQDIGLVGRRSFGTGLNELLDTAGLSKETLLQKFASKPKQLQNITEETSKLNVFKTWIQRLGREKGLGLEAALKDKDLVSQAMNKAEEAIFSPYRISQAERTSVARYIPFYSFTRQALPFTAKTLVNNPKSIAVFGKIKSAIEGLTEQPNIELPDYMKNQIRLSKTDKEGNVKYFDPSYIYPFGNFVESGLGKGQLPFGLSFNPFAMEVVQQLANKDLYFNSQIAKSNLTPKRVAQRLAHLYRTVSPAVLVTLTNTIYPALVGKKDSQGRTRNVGQAILSALGIKTSSINLENQQIQNLRSEKSKSSSIQQEMDSTINDPNLNREKKDKILRSLQEVQ
ncbi:hypothetical protein M0R04_12435 [Candidatus Dojkabacteria bacterium]|jgi:hypothetical protein|nr:hypothetical protein [Candidatus Dojkabacteria bacterium]